MPEEQAVEGQKSLPLTTRGKPTKFTPERLQQIINLVERGKSRDEIADILGVTVGSLQVTCSKLGISLRRPKIANGGCFEQKRNPLCENVSLTHHSSDHDGGQVPFEPTEEQSEACPASVAIRFQYRGMERTDELPLTMDMIGQLALVAALRRVSIGELIAELITAMMNKDLFPLVPDNVGPESTGRWRGSTRRRAKKA